MRFENGEEDKVGVKGVEPDEEFLPPTIGQRVCCTVKGGKYSAEIVAITASKLCKVYGLSLQL